MLSHRGSRGAQNILARQPGPEVAEQLQIYQQTVKDKNRQMKAMASELNMYQAQIAEYKFEIERVARELQDTKKRYFEQKKRENAARDRERLEAQRVCSRLQPITRDCAQITAPNASTGARFAGGGFNLSQTMS